MAVEEEEERTQQDPHRDQIVLVNMTTQAMVILHGQQEVFEEHSAAATILPASAASIQSIKTVAPVPEEECSVCLNRFGDMAKEMPCGHRFHVGCIERWLGLHGSCPLCRYQMPGTEVRKLHGANGIWVAISLSRGIIDRQRDHGVGSSA
ncbi:E3 ubiquitin-protein ligase RING1-like protein [Carex littledalei]|uniref:E3 ubiquitin-protein ligase RING1-like protein n=1 Tax=Carex littledalei TaxID=544730 RepID=A0A833QTE1_9POAL|nr:E3 ubiquitin-protein ligase RING1-like protein [Carex littledalei]